MNSLYTIGIGNRTVGDFITELQNRGVQFLVDVRSYPYSKVNHGFDRDNIQIKCKEAGINYLYWGDALGGFPKHHGVLTGGRVDYEKLAQQPEFQQYIGRLIEGLKKGFAIAVFCSEARPEMCHRSKCIGVELDRIGVEVLHIDAGNRLITQKEVYARIIGGQHTLPGFEQPLRSRRSWGRK